MYTLYTIRKYVFVSIIQDNRYGIVLWNYRLWPYKGAIINTFNGSDVLYENKLQLILQVQIFITKFDRSINSVPL